MQFPEPFTSNIRHAFAETGEIFLASLPALIEEASRRWELADVQPVPNLSYNYVAFAKRRDKKVILKLGVPNPELNSEMNALKLFNGEGACRLFDCDEQKGFMLIERLQPGNMLADLKDDDERTHIAIDVMQKIWRPAPQDMKFIRLEDWFVGLKNIRPKFDGGTGPFPREIFEHVETILPELFMGEQQLIHGDFHHFNILSSERGWLIIDPKGVVGPVGYEVGPLMLNPWYGSMDSHQFKVHAERRVDIFRERLDWEREKIIGWALAHSVLSAYWDLELDPTYSFEAAKIFSEM